MKSFIVIIILLASAYAYVQYTFNEKEKLLLETAEPFQSQCEMDSGCVISPSDWRKENGFYSNGFMEYRTTESGFTIHYHIATDTWLLAKGGKGLELTIENIGEY
ncbi:MAG: hypothetical protein GY951_11385 [Psychromonas sp.]|nr:hypothetical protein [Psychromonas sp.]